jgi:hypothetical protein
MGMVTVLVTSDDNLDAAHLNAGADGVHIHYKTNDLAAFLKALQL